MTDTLAGLIPIAQKTLFAGFIVFLRVAAVVTLLPAFGEKSVPQRVKLALALAFTLVIAPAVGSSVVPLKQGARIIAPFLLSEIIIGLALGMMLRLLVLVLEIAGTVAAHSTSLSQAFGGAGVNPQPAMGAVLVFAGLALAVATGLHVRAAQAMILSYEILPPGRLPDAGVLADWGVAQIARGFALAVTLAMPFVIASLIYNLALGVINRAMPQLMVALVGAPAITAAGLILLFLAAPALLSIWSDWMIAILANPFEVSP